MSRAEHFVAIKIAPKNNKGIQTQTDVAEIVQKKNIGIPGQTVASK
jgi:hypothetical protein